MINNGLRFSPWWLAGGAALVLLVVWGSLATSDTLGPPAGTDKLMHMVSYFTLMAWFSGIYRRKAHWLVALLLCLLGVALEGLQLLGGVRQGEIADVVANTAGVAMGLMFGLLIPGGWCRHVERFVTQ